MPSYGKYEFILILASLAVMQLSRPAQRATAGLLALKRLGQAAFESTPKPSYTFSQPEGPLAQTFHKADPEGPLRQAFELLLNPGQKAYQHRSEQALAQRDLWLNPFPVDIPGFEDPLWRKEGGRGPRAQFFQAVGERAAYEAKEQPLKRGAITALMFPKKPATKQSNFTLPWQTQSARAASGAETNLTKISPFSAWVAASLGAYINPSKAPPLSSLLSGIGQSQVGKTGIVVKPVSQANAGSILIGNKLYPASSSAYSFKVGDTVQVSKDGLYLEVQPTYR